nr:SIR2 family protein [Massilia sp. DJPM01]
MPFDDEDLSAVYSAAKQKLQARLSPILETYFRYTSPSDEYYTLAEYAWRRIYTLNIDDALQTAITRKSKQNLAVRLAADSVENHDPMYERLDLVKLNGSATRLSDGIIFSASEYAKATGASLPWYDQSANDFISTPFLFIGTKANEPLLKFHIERYKDVHGSAPGVSYLITPSASEIQKLDLESYNIKHIAGTLEDFVSWLKIEFPDPITPFSLAVVNIPQLGILAQQGIDRAKLDLFDDVTLVRRGMIAPLNASDKNSDHIRDFYKGFHPGWDDIVQQIPAELAILEKVVLSTIQNTPLTVVVGPAGCGKSTLIMQAALRISDTMRWSVYFLNEVPEDLTATLKEIEISCDESIETILIVMDNLDSFANDLVEFRQTRRRRIRFLGAERENVWSNKVSRKLSSMTPHEVNVSDFTEPDALQILIKLERYGSWTRLGQLTQQQRIDELMVRARRQLLIALMEATSGVGFEKIIESEYKSISSDDERLLLLVVGLATANRASLKIELLNRALNELGLLRNSAVLLGNLVGIVQRSGDKLSVRHPVYINHLIDRVVDPQQIERAIKALLGALGKYENPVMKHMDKRESRIYKGLINFKFLRKALHGKKELILNVYRNTEKKFEQDGLFWLQYGLAYRGFHEHYLALEKLRVAVDAYRMAHTEHALAQQLLILAPFLTSEATAKEYLSEAKTLLVRLDGMIDSDDIYPIVTMALGEVKVVQTFDGPAAARELAGNYANEINERLRTSKGDKVLRRVWEALTRYASTGIWDELIVHDQH